MKYLLTSYLILLAFTFAIGQNINIEAKYKKTRVQSFTGKVGILTSGSILLNGNELLLEPLDKSMKQWSISGNGYKGEAKFNSDPVQGIWWNIKDNNGITTVLLSSDETDTNDPREYKITSSNSRGIYMVFNEEPDCNSEFVLMESAESPTLLTGVARTLAYARSSNPCRNGKWEVTLESEVPDDILLSFVFASVQSFNVRFFDEL